MKHTHVLKAVCAAAVVSLAIAVPSAVAAGSAPKVSVRVEGLNKTLMAAKTVQSKTGSYKRSGHPVSYASALGALTVATHSNWAGSWSKQYKEWSVTGILGESHAFTSKDYWAVYVNGVQASTGAGEVKLKAGEKLVYAAIPDADYNAQLINVTVSKSVRAGKADTVKIAAYNPKGKSVALKGATVSFAGHSKKASGSSTTVKTSKAGKFTLKVSKSGYVRTEAVITVKKA